MKWYIPPSSKRGTSVPGARVSFESAAGPGNGVGLGVAGRANTPFEAVTMLFAAALPPTAPLLDVALFSLFAAFVVASPAPLLFCCAHSGKAKSAPITNAAHQLRISTLLSSLNRIPFDSRARLRTTRSSWPGCVRCIAAVPLVASSSLGSHLSPHPIPDPREKPEEAKGRGAVRLFHNSLSAQLLPRSRAITRGLRIPRPTRHPSFRTQQADFFFRIRSCECVGLRRETSTPSRAFCGMKSLFSPRANSVTLLCRSDPPPGFQ